MLKMVNHPLATKRLNNVESLGEFFKTLWSIFFMKGLKNSPSDTERRRGALCSQAIPEYRSR